MIGNIHDVRFWSKTFSPAQANVAKDKTLSGRELNLLGYWTLDEGNGNVGIDKAKSRIQKYTSSKKRNGILLKFPKPNQDLRTDLPTVGIRTLKKCVNIGLKGIVIKSGYNIFLDKKNSIKIANKNKMFVTVI